MRAVHADDKLMIRHRLVDEAPARGIDGNQAGLGAVEREMRIGAAPAGEPSGLGHRRPERRLRVIVLDHGAGRTRHGHALAACARESNRMLERWTHIFVELLTLPPNPPVANRRRAAR